MATEGRKHTNSQPELLFVKHKTEKRKQKNPCVSIIFFSFTTWFTVSFRFDFCFDDFRLFSRSFSQRRIFCDIFFTICCVLISSNFFFRGRAFRVKFIYLAHSLWRFQYSQIITIKIGNRRKKHTHTHRVREGERDRDTHERIYTHTCRERVWRRSSKCLCMCNEQRK